MAGRVNTRFVIILVVILTALVGATAAAVMFFGQRDPAKHLAQAQNLEAQAERLMQDPDAASADPDDQAEHTPAQRKLRDAAEQYRRAFQLTDPHQREMKIRILRHLASIYRRYEVEDTDELREWLAGIEQVWSRLLKIDPTDRQAREALLEISLERAELAGNRVQLWNQLYNQADEALAAAAGNEPLVRRYRGLAQIVRLEKLNLNEDHAFEQAQEDLRIAREAFPDDPEVAFASARLKLIEADRLTGMEPEKAKALRDQSLTRINQFIEDHPDNLSGRLGRYKILIQRYAISRDDQWREKALNALDDLEQRLLESAEYPDVARQVAQQIMRLDNSVGEVDGRQTRMGLHRAEQLLRAVVAQHPDDTLALTMLGQVLRDQGRLEHAIRFFKLAQSSGTLPVEVRALLTGQLRRNAARRLVELYVALHDRRDGEEAQAALDNARRYVQALRDQAGPAAAALALLAEGQLALAEGRNGLAVKKLEQAAARFEQPDAVLLRALATALTRRGQHGAAAARLAELIETSEGRRQPAAYLQLASLRLQAGETDEAMPLIDRILDVAPNHPGALALKARAMQMSAGSQAQLQQARRDAIAMLEKHVDDSDSRQLTLQYARLLRQVDRDDQALAVLEDYYQDHPGDRTVLQTLVGFDLAMDQRDRARQRVQKAIEENPDDDALQALRVAVEGDLSPEERLKRAETLLLEQEDPVDRHLALYQLYTRTDQPEKAEQALDAVEEIDPDNQRVQEIRLTRAIRDQRWEDAARIVDWAKTANEGQGVDYAGGAFWEGRLMLARDQAETAVQTLRRGVEQMPSDSTGHLLLGVALKQNGDLIEAQRAIEKSLELQPTNADAWRQLHTVQHARGQHQAALESLRLAIRHGGRNNPQLLSRFIDYTGAYGDREVAIRAREQMAEQAPGNHDNRRKLARLYYNAGRNEDAMAVMQQLMADPPADRQNVSTLAYLLVADDRVDEAQDLFDRFIKSTEANAQNPDNWLAYARALSAGGKAGLADSTFRRAIQLDDSPQLPATREYADWLMARQQFDDAADLYRRIMNAESVNPDVADSARRRFAEASLRGGDLDTAQAQVDQLLAEKEDDGQLILLRAMIAQARAEQTDLTDAQRQQARATAQRAVEQAVRVMPDAPETHLAWARMHFDQQDPETRRLVREHLERVIELGGNQPLARRLLVQWHRRDGDLDAAIGVQEARVAAAPQQSQPRVELAQLYLAAGDRNAQLRQLLDESEELIPDQPAWPQLRARMHQARGNLANALEQMRLAYERDPSAGRTIEFLDLMLRAGRHRPALDLLDERPELVRQSPIIQAMRGRAMYRLGREEPGKNALRAAIADVKDNPAALQRVLSQVIPAMPAEQAAAFLEQMTGDDPTGQITMAMFNALFRGGAHEQLLAKADQVGTLSETAGDAMERDRLRMVALAAAQTERFERAEAAYRKLLEMDPDDMLALNNLAFMLADNMDQPEKALPIAERAAELLDRGNRSARANVLDTLGWVQFRAGRLREASQTLRESIDAESLVDNHLHLAEVFRAMDRPASARREVNTARALAEESNDPKVRERVETVARMLDATAAEPNEVTP